MRNLLKFIVRYHFTFLFIILEIVAFILIIRLNTFHRARFMDFTYALKGGFSRVIMHAKEYLSLREENRKLIEENNSSLLG
jgi:rod shape-determining protein MreC